MRAEGEVDTQREFYLFIYRAAPSSTAQCECQQTMKEAQRHPATSTYTTNQALNGHSTAEGD